MQTLCGKSTLPRVTAIPTVTTDQLPGDFGNGDYGWCLACCAEMVRQWRGFVEEAAETPVNQHLMALYSGSVWVAVNQLSMVK